MARVLIVEDNRNLAHGLRTNLEFEGHRAEIASDGDAGLRRARSGEHDIVVLDLMLPELDGYRVLETLRREGHTVPVLVLTARGDEADKVRGLESGADDYVTKPFGVRELMARVAALLRRHDRGAERAQPAAAVRTSQLSLDRDRRQAAVRGASVELTKQEFDLLYLLAARPGVVFSRAALLQQVWSGDTYVTERTVDTVISRLRRKIERDAQDPEMLLTAWGVGYKFSAPG